MVFKKYTLKHVEILTKEYINIKVSHMAKKLKTKICHCRRL